MPYPENNESHEDYMPRCMANEEMQKYPQDQRYAICQSYWDNKDKNQMNQFAYKTIKNVPIFDEDDNYDEEKLKLIVEANNKRCLDTGDTSPIIFGHTIEGLPETDQPPVVGYADNYHLGQIGFLNPRTTVLADFHIDECYEDEAKQYTTRSVELWTDDLIIHPIALLKTSRPAKSLGPLNFSAENRDKLRKYYKEEEIDMDIETLQKLIIDTINASDMAAAVKQIMEDKAKEALAEDETLKPVEDASEAIETPEEAVEGEAPDTEEEKEIADEAVKEGEEHPELPAETVEQIAEDHVEEAEVDKNEATPSGSNTFVPAIEGEEKKPEDEDEEKKKKMAMDAEVTKYKMDLETTKAIADKYAAEFKKMADERNDYANKLICSERANELLKLSYEYNFNADEELKLVQTMDSAQYEQHKNIIMSRYSKVPLGRAVVSPVKELPDSNRISQEKVLEIVRFANKNKLSFEEARRQVING